jgi:hypothetical protein
MIIWSSMNSNISTTPIIKQIPWNKGKKGLQTAWNKGIKIDRTKYPNYGHFKKHTPEARQKMTAALQKWRDRTSLKEQNIARTKGHAKAIATGLSRGSYKGQIGKFKEESSGWLGESATYNSKHRWIQNNWKKTGVCETCGKSPKPYGNRRWGTEWHSLDGKYNREDRTTWLELCKPCHNIKDKL